MSKKQSNLLLKIMTKSNYFPLKRHNKHSWNICSIKNFQKYVFLEPSFASNKTNFGPLVNSESNSLLFSHSHLRSTRHRIRITCSFSEYWVGAGNSETPTQNAVLIQHLMLIPACGRQIVIYLLLTRNVRLSSSYHGLLNKNK